MVYGGEEGWETFSGWRFFFPTQLGQRLAARFGFNFSFSLFFFVEEEGGREGVCVAAGDKQLDNIFCRSEQHKH